ncbi:MAG TPA: iron-sulfur cluster assembly scaffold protein [Aggregatilineales bacterium]|jgi:nitrogen fixation NifU-like protein|nr:iron-sulfur cluster assembly scaffold protein [Aggregatilineales bacterium]
MDDMYREHILDHAMHMRYRGLLDPADIDHEELNHSCGDRLRLTLRIDANRRITAVGWDGDGCAISQATASMLGEEILGKTLEEVQNITRDDILEMVGIPLTINRLKCALLSLKTLIVGTQGMAYWQHLEDEDDE